MAAVSAKPAVSPARLALAENLMSLVPLLRRTFQSRVTELVEQEFGSATPHQMEALHLLHLTNPGARGDQGATMNELARHQQCALSTATALVDRLLRQGLAERIPDPEDRRVVRIAATEKGLLLQARFAELKRDIALQAISALDDDELATLIRLLRKITDDDSATSEKGGAA